MFATEKRLVSRIRVADRAVKEAERRLGRARHSALRARDSYARQRPLTEREHELLIKRVREGGALCCADGRAWLIRHVPEPWAEALNRWAYEALACKDRAHRAEDVDKVMRLKRDRFPGVEQ